jgi:hypothetical protein
MVDLYLHSPIRLRGLVLNELNTETTLPFTLRTDRRVQHMFLHGCEYQFPIIDMT